MSVKTYSVDRGLKRILKEVAKMKKNPYIKVGFPKESTKTQNEESPGVTVLDVAIFHEFGTSKMPERSFIRATFAKNRVIYREITDNEIGKILFGRQTVEGALHKLGLKMVADIKNYIREGKVRPQSKRVTREKKERREAVTLYDTGQMINSLAYSISINGKTASAGRDAL